MTIMPNNAKRFIVFLGAPTTSQLRSDHHLTYSWNETIINSPKGEVSTVHPSPATAPITNENLSVADAESSSFFPPGTFEEASRRISLLYRNVIFNDDDDAEDEEERQRQLETTLLEVDAEGGDESGWDDYARPGREHTRRDETTVISWPPTYDDSSASASPASVLAMPTPSANRPGQNDKHEDGGSSMLLASSSQAETPISISQRSYSKNTSNVPALLSKSVSGIQNADTTGMTTTTSFFLSQENRSLSSTASSTTTLLSTDDSMSISNTAAYASVVGNTSIGHFPRFTFSMHTLSSLSSLTNQGLNKSKGSSSNKANLLLAVLEVDGLQTIRLRRGPQAGASVSLLKLVLADNDGGLARLVVWRELADIWAGGSGGVSVPAGRQQQHQQILEAGGVKRGDVVYLENISSSKPTDPSGPFFNQQQQKQSLTLTASPNLGSRLTICYRTMPEPTTMRNTGSNKKDVLRALRPDLRLGASDAGVRRVATLVAWFERMAGLS